MILYKYIYINTTYISKNMDFSNDIAIIGCDKNSILIGINSMNNDLKIRAINELSPLKISLDYFISNNSISNVKNFIKFKRPLLYERFDGDMEKIIKYLNLTAFPGARNLPDDFLIEVISTSNPNKCKLPSNIVNGIMSVEDIQNKLAKPTLVLRYPYWDIFVDNYEFDIDNCDKNKNIIINGINHKITDVDRSIYIKFYKFNISNHEYILAIDENDKIETLEEAINRLNMDINMVNKIKTETEYFTASGYKSFLQKLIRFHSKYVVIGNDKYECSEIVKYVFLILMYHPGSFVPDLQKFVRGTESATKRLAISITEDSYTEYFEEITSLLHYTLISQFISSWKPTYNQLKIWVKMAELSVKDSRTFRWKENRDGGDIETININSSKLLKLIGSFQSDIDLLYKCKKYKGDMPNKLNIDINQFIYHSIDQHWQTGLLYFFPLNIIEQFKINKDSLPLEEVMKFIWNYSSSINLRYDEFIDTTNFDIIKQVQETFHLFSLNRISEIDNNYYLGYNPKDLQKSVKYTSNIDYTIPKSAILPLVGLQYYKGAMMCLNSKDITRICVSKKISRDMKDHKIDPNLEDAARSEMIKKLKKGINGVVINGDEITVDNKPLDEWVENNHKSDVYKSPNKLKNRELITTNDVDILLNCPNFDKKYINRAKYYIYAGGKEIVFPSISRDGGDISKNDLGAYKVISYMSSVSSSILKRKNFKTFSVKNIYLLRGLYNSLFDNYDSECESRSDNNYDNIIDNDKRLPYTHQLEALSEMKEKSNNFLWIPPGMGKTYIVCSYIRYLYTQTDINPKYILYTMPSSAFKGVETELMKWNLNINVLDVKKSNKDVIQMNAFNDNLTINLIEHDKLRILNDDFQEYMSDTLFIVDEVHKTLAQTQRTSATLTLATLSNRFIALTGTPVINNRMEMLIQWLKLITDYEIDKNTFHMAISNLVSKQVSTGVKMINKEIFLDITNVKFYDHVGRRLGGTCDKCDSNDFKIALDIAYDTCDIEIVNQAIKFIDNGVFIVTRNLDHQEKIKCMLMNKGVNSSRIGLINNKEKWNLVNIKDNGPDIIITTIRHSEGYTLTKLGVMITSVYFSNLATREQLDGRINRISQERTEIVKMLIMTTLLDVINDNYNYVSGISQLMKMIK